MPNLSHTFVLVAEVMSLNIRNNKNIKGIKINDKQKIPFKISQLADDTTLFLDSKNDIQLALNEIEIFGTYSGLILNREKSKGIKLGNQNIIDDYFESICWTEKAIKTLGIFFGHDQKTLYEKNWENKIDKIRKIVNQWKGRKLTIIGRIQIVKSLIASQFTYAASILTIPKKIKDEFQKKVYRYIWDGKVEKNKKKNYHKRLFRWWTENVRLRVTHKYIKGKLG